eukprot:1146583-Pelagomonas_calceolata.AAC.7
MKLGGQFVDLQASCGCLAGQDQIDTLTVWIGALKGIGASETGGASHKKLTWHPGTLGPQISGRNHQLGAAGDMKGRSGWRLGFMLLQSSSSATERHYQVGATLHSEHLKNIATWRELSTSGT